MNRISAQKINPKSEYRISKNSKIPILKNLDSPDFGIRSFEIVSNFGFPVSNFISLQQKPHLSPQGMLPGQRRKTSSLRMASTFSRSPILAFSMASPQDLDRLIIDLPVHGIRMAVFSSVGKAEPGRIFKARLGPVDQFRDEAQGPKGLGTDAGDAKKRLRNPWASLLVNPDKRSSPAAPGGSLPWGRGGPSEGKVDSPSSLPSR